jgi:hypothetical protein
MALSDAVKTRLNSIVRLSHKRRGDGTAIHIAHSVALTMRREGSHTPLFECSSGYGVLQAKGESPHRRTLTRFSDIGAEKMKAEVIDSFGFSFIYWYSNSPTTATKAHCTARSLTTCRSHHFEAPLRHEHRRLGSYTPTAAKLPAHKCTRDQLRRHEERTTPTSPQQMQ